MASRRRLRHEEEHENSERWLVSYADFITLLFAFFTVLYATSEQNVEEAKKFEQSMRKFLSVAVAGETAAGGESPLFERSTSVIESPFQAPGRPPKSNYDIESYLEKYLRQKLTPSEYQSLILEIYSDREGVRIRLNGRSLFAQGTSVISAQSVPALNKIGELLKKTAQLVIVEGHTSSEPPSHYPTNWELSSARAAKIVRYLTERSRLPQDQLSIRAFADSKPYVDKESEESPKNERVDLLISNQSTEE